MSVYSLPREFDTPDLNECFYETKTKLAAFNGMKWGRLVKRKSLWRVSGFSAKNVLSPLNLFAKNVWESKRSETKRHAICVYQEQQQASTLHFPFKKNHLLWLFSFFLLFLVWLHSALLREGDTKHSTFFYSNSSACDGEGKEALQAHHLSFKKTKAGDTSWEDYWGRVCVEDDQNF